MTDKSAGPLGQWLQRIERQHPVEIDMGLDRVRQVHGGLGLPADLETAIIVAGTNGKGSCVSYLEAIYQAAGYRTGVYTSPHLHRYNERIRVDGLPVGDEEIVAAFDRIEAARGDVSLTYFEYSTLAALAVFQKRQVEVFLLEVGMGGRLDAVNVINAPVSIVTSIGLDHQGWLGNDREAIGREKAGVFRRGQVAVSGDDRPPRSLAEVANQEGTKLLRIGHDFSFNNDANAWSWQGSIVRYDELELPRFGGHEQFSNASCALAAIEQLGPVLRVDGEHINTGLRNAEMPGRLQTIEGQHRWILDVAHNGEAAQALAESLAGFGGRTVAVIGMMDDKPVEAVARALNGVVDDWIVVSSGANRAMAAAELASRLARIVDGPISSATSVSAALEAAAAIVSPVDRILVTGSFLVVGPALSYLSRHA